MDSVGYKIGDKVYVNEAGGKFGPFEIESIEDDEVMLKDRPNQKFHISILEPYHPPEDVPEITDVGC